MIHAPTFKVPTKIRNCKNMYSLYVLFECKRLKALPRTSRTKLGDAIDRSFRTRYVPLKSSLTRTKPKAYETKRLLVCTRDLRERNLLS